MRDIDRSPRIVSASDLEPGDVLVGRFLHNGALFTATAPRTILQVQTAIVEWGRPAIPFTYRTATGGIGGSNAAANTPMLVLR